MWLRLVLLASLCPHRAVFRLMMGTILRCRSLSLLSLVTVVSALCMIWLLLLTLARSSSLSLAASWFSVKTVEPDGGVTWNPLYSLAPNNWYGVASTCDMRSIIVGSGNTAYMKVSRDGGGSWADVTSAGQAKWLGISVSYDFTNVYACKFGSYCSWSRDGTTTWACP